VRALTDEQIAAMRDPRLAATTKLPRIDSHIHAPIEALAARKFNQNRVRLHDRDTD
jgi:hypothetical protein